jgi:hypothetical protein
LIVFEGEPAAGLSAQIDLVSEPGRLVVAHDDDPIPRPHFDKFVDQGEDEPATQLRIETSDVDDQAAGPFHCHESPIRPIN